MLDKLLASGSLPLVVAGLVASGLGLPLPEDPLVLSAGVLAHRTALPAWLLLPVAFGAAVAADCVLLLLARRYGEDLLQRKPLRYLATPSRRERVSALFAKHGPRAVFFGRHLFGLRPLVFAVAGMEGMPLSTFLLWDAFAAAVTIPLVFLLGFFFSAQVALVEADLARAEHVLGLVLGVLLLMAWLTWSLLRGGWAGRRDGRGR